MKHPIDSPLSVDFTQVAEKDSAFATLWNDAHHWLNFEDPETLRILTASTLRVYFGIKVELPSDRLCPPVPIRFEYIRWLNDLLHSTSGHYFAQKPTGSAIGIDIGTGASCIYPLLGCASRAHWKFGGTEIDEKSYRAASHNVELNKLEDRIKLVKVEAGMPLIPMDILGFENADFVMCNPPFFTSLEDMQAGLTNKSKAPSAICTGDDVEMICPGGEVGFVTRIIEESEKLGERVQWYSSMFGKMASAQEILELLQSKGITNTAVKTIVGASNPQGKGRKTHRWLVAWSFQDFRPTPQVCRASMMPKHVLPYMTTIRLEMKRGSDFYPDRLKEIMCFFDLKWAWYAKCKTGVAEIQACTWTRHARRDAKIRTKQETNSSLVGPETISHKAEPVQSEEELVGAEDVESVLEKPSMVVGISIDPDHGQVVLHWYRGHVHKDFESFKGMLDRELHGKAEEKKVPTTHSGTLSRRRILGE